MTDELTDLPPALTLVLQPGAMDIHGTPVECSGMCECPFATVNDSLPAPNPDDTGEGHYDCALTGKPKVWGEDPICTPDQWRARALTELKAMLTSGQVAPVHPREVNDAFHKLDADGRGKCFAFVFREDGTGLSACGQEAYGEQVPGHVAATVRRVTGLACPAHGGPPSRVFRDGNGWYAVMPDFPTSQEYEAGFGATPEHAREALRGGRDK